MASLLCKLYYCFCFKKVILSCIHEDATFKEFYDSRNFWWLFSCLVVSDSLPGFPVFYHLLEFTQTHVHWVDDAISSSAIPFSSCLQSFPASGSFLLIRWPKYWSFSFNISPSNEYSGLISFRIDWFGLLSVQGTLKSLLQHHSLKASILWCSAFFIVQLSHPYMTTGKKP